MSFIDEETLEEVKHLLHAFHDHWEFFRDAGVRATGFSLPQQHSMTHYPDFIIDFGAPNGLCSSITESQHITAVKKPWRRSNCWNALSQMLQTNQCLDKLSAMRADFVQRGMLPTSHDQYSQDDDEDGGAIDDCVDANVVLARCQGKVSSYSSLDICTDLIPSVSNYPSDITELGNHVGFPQLALLTQRFLYDQLNPNSLWRPEDLPYNALPDLRTSVSVFRSAVATFFAPSDLSGIHGMRQEWIRATPSW